MIYSLSLKGNIYTKGFVFNY